MGLEYIIDPSGCLLIDTYRGYNRYFVKVRTSDHLREKGINLNWNKLASLAKYNSNDQQLWSVDIRDNEEDSGMQSNNQIFWIVKACLFQTKTLNDFLAYFEKTESQLASTFKSENDVLDFVQRLHETFLMQENLKLLDCGHKVNEDTIYYKIQGKSCCRTCYIEKGFDPDE